MLNEKELNAIGNEKLVPFVNSDTSLQRLARRNSIYKQVKGQKLLKERRNNIPLATISYQSFHRVSVMQDQRSGLHGHNYSGFHRLEQH